MVSQLPASFGDTFERKVYFCKNELFCAKEMDHIVADQNEVTWETAYYRQNTFS